MRALLDSADHGKQQTELAEWQHAVVEMTSVISKAATEKCSV